MLYESQNESKKRLVELLPQKNLLRIFYQNQSHHTFNQLQTSQNHLWLPLKKIYHPARHTMEKNLHKYYKIPVILDAPLGNNAFSFEARKQYWSACQITIPIIKVIENENVSESCDFIKLWNDIVFEEVDEKGNLHSCSGLDAIYEIQKKDNTPIFLMDNHNHALYLRTLAFQKMRLGAWASLIHIDQHADMEIPWTPIDKSQYDIFSKNFGSEQLDYIARYTNEVCNVGNFIQPAIDSGLVQETIQVRSVAKLIETGLTGDPTHTKNTNTILDIDIDFFVDHEPSNEELVALKLLYQRSAVCTIALSPYFIDIQKALKIAQHIIGFFRIGIKDSNNR